MEDNIMKRAISLILAVCFVAALIPSAFLVDAAPRYSNAMQYYVFGYESQGATENILFDTFKTYTDYSHWVSKGTNYG